ncbi:hypothetical protein Tco_1421556, partial [Tanacetum coccineum]
LSHVIRRRIALEQASPAYVLDPMELEDHVQSLSPGYIVDSDPEENEEDPADYHEEEEHLAPADSTAVASPAVDHVPSVKETKPFETDESAATPPLPPAYRITSRMYVRTQTPIPFPSKEEVARLLALPTLPPSPLTPLSSPPTSPTYA